MDFQSVLSWRSPLCSSLRRCRSSFAGTKSLSTSIPFAFALGKSRRRQSDLPAALFLCPPLFGPWDRPDKQKAKVCLCSVMYFRSLIFSLLLWNCRTYLPYSYFGLFLQFRWFVKSEQFFSLFLVYFTEFQAASGKDIDRIYKYAIFVFAGGSFYTAPCTIWKNMQRRIQKWKDTSGCSVCF